MTNYGHVERITVETEKGEITFRSKFEYRWYVWCQFRKDQGIIADWWYEDPDSILELEKGYHLNIKEYHPDFTILYPNGDYEFEETKGYFPAVDATTLRLAAQQYETPVNLIFARTPKFGFINGVVCNCRAKNKKTLAQITRAVALEPHIKRIIWNANKDIFENIKYLIKE